MNHRLLYIFYFLSVIIYISYYSLILLLSLENTSSCVYLVSFSSATLSAISSKYSVFSNNLNIASIVIRCLRGREDMELVGVWDHPETAGHFIGMDSGLSYKIMSGNIYQWRVRWCENNPTFFNNTFFIFVEISVYIKNS